MALTTKQLLNFSWMSQAAYLDFLSLAQNDQLGLNDRLQNNTINQGKLFASGQATTFTDPADGFSFINYMPNDNSGFSATVFQNNGTTNDYTIAVRGTEPSFVQSVLGATADLLNADVLGVALQGAAYDQAISAYRYYKQLTTTSGQQVSYSTAELTKIGAMYNETLLVLPVPILDTVLRTVLVNQFLASLTDIADASNVGLGSINATTANIHFTGHSLGGHVATLLASMVQQFGQGNVADVTTYNAPGQGGLFNVNPVIDATAISAKTTNIISEGGMTVTPNVGNAAGAISQLFIEEEGLVANHSIVKLSDSLALYNLFATLDPTLNDGSQANLDTISDILKASSNVAENSLESAITSLGKLFNVANTTFNANEFDTNRNDLYTALDNFNAMLDAPQFSVVPTIQSLTSLDAATLNTNAQANTPEGEAYRYAMQELNPFIAIGPDYTSFNSNGELDVFDSNTGLGQLTGQYLTDRAAMLDLLMQRNTVDGSIVSSDIVYRDVDRNITLSSTTTLSTQTYLQNIKFGGAGEDPLIGGNLADRLYGMGGIDALQGKGGDDILFGGKGDAANSSEWKMAA